MAIVKGTGENVLRDMSHFACHAYGWAGAFGGELMNTGWLGRYNDRANEAQPLGAVATAAEALEAARLAAVTAESVEELPSAGGSGSLADQLSVAASLIAADLQPYLEAPLPS